MDTRVFETSFGLDTSSGFDPSPQPRSLVTYRYSLALNEVKLGSRDYSLMGLMGKQKGHPSPELDTSSGLDPDPEVGMLFIYRYSLGLMLHFTNCSVHPDPSNSRLSSKDKSRMYALTVDPYYLDEARAYAEIAGPYENTSSRSANNTDIFIKTVDMLATTFHPHSRARRMGRTSLGSRKPKAKHHSLKCRMSRTSLHRRHPATRKYLMYLGSR
jgi:hypothetical protein